MRLKMTIYSLDEATAKINLLDTATRIAVRSQVRKSANALRKNMKNRAPEGPTGNLKESIKAKYSPDQLSAEVGPTYGKGSHAHLVEFGHRLVTKDGQSIGHVPAHPFITPAAEEERPKYVDDMKKAIRGAVRK